MLLVAAWRVARSATAIAFAVVTTPTRRPRSPPSPGPVKFAEQPSDGLIAYAVHWPTSGSVRT